MNKIKLLALENLRWVTALVLLLPSLVLAADGDLTLSAPVFDSKVTIQTRNIFAGAISSLTFRGKEYYQ